MPAEPYYAQNDECFNLNATVLDLLPEDNTEYYSVNSTLCDDPDEASNYSIKFLNSLFTPEGMPTHLLLLKAGAIVMLTRNLNSELGLRIGTRCVVNQLMVHFIDVQVLPGEEIGTRIYIQRIDLARLMSTCRSLSNDVNFLSDWLLL